MSSLEPAKRNYLPPIIIFILTTYQLIRIIVFANVYGGVEHDGGWALTVSRSLAEQGTYTTTVSTIVDPNIPGGLDIHRKFHVQAPDGRIWFRSTSVTGPASIVPEALALKIFGTGFWGLLAGPLIFFTFFLLLAASILHRLAGIGAVVLFHLFLFFYPHISIFLSYQGLGEVPSMVYVLWAYLAFMAATQKEQRRWLYFLMAGLIIGLAVNAKLITLWSVSGIFMWAGILWLVWQKDNPVVAAIISKSQKFLATTLSVKWLQGDTLANHDSNGSDPILKNVPNENRLGFSEIFLMGSGMVLILSLWEIIQWATLVWLTNFEMYLGYTQQRLDEILDQGSGMRLRIHSGSEFFWDKFFRLEEVAHPQRWVTTVIFVTIFVGGLVLLWLWRGQPRKRNLLAPIWIGWLVNTTWYVSLSKTGWPRHFWFGMVLAVMLLCVILVTTVQLGIEGQRDPEKKSGLFPLAAGIVLLVLVGWGFVSQPHVWGFFLRDELIPYWQEKQINHKYGASLPWIIIPRAEQAEIVAYLEQLPLKAHIYFPFQHKSAEISALTGRIVYPLDRRELMGKHAQDVVIVGPSLVAPWMEPGRRETLRGMVREECPQPIIANDYYMICPFPTE